MSTCNRLDWGTLGSQPVMPKNLPGHCAAGYNVIHTAERKYLVQITAVKYP